MAVQTDCKSVTEEIKALQLHDKPSAVGMIKEPLGMDNITLNIAITGESGSGKSSFVNAFRGIDDEDEEAAATGTEETTHEVTPYPHPEYRNVTLWDLPGIGTTKFPADKYLEQVGFEKFDFFIIVSAVRFKENDVKLAQEIQRMKKKFYFVRSKTDRDIKAERRKRDFSEKRTLTTIRDDCVQGVRRLGIESPQVFLVSSFELHLYDFSLLQKTLERELPEHKRDALLFATPSVNLEIISKKKEAFKTLSTSTDDQFGFALLKEEINEALLKNDQPAAAAKIKELMMKEKNIRLNIAITGESGSGKSTFVNVLRGLSDDDKGAAPTGVTETTSEVTPYPHPNYPNVTLWDLPGIGSTKFPADKYPELVGFEKFDFFIIISADRFRENDVKLTQEIQRMKKRFYFVHSKIDEDIQAEKRKKNFNKERTLTKIRDGCVQRLRGLGIESPQVFLVSSFELRLYDFSRLHKTLDRDLPAHKRDVLLRAMPNFSPEIIRKKKQALKSKVKYWAILSAVGAAVPVPGLSIAVDAVLLVGVVTDYVHVFGLDIWSLKRLSVITSPLVTAEISIPLLLKVIAQLGSVAALIAAEETTRLIPFIGIPVSAGLSFTTTYKILNLILDQLAEDAQKVFEKTQGLNTV